MKRTAFTLFELLVVVAVIGVLCSMSLTAFMRSKDKGKWAADISNLRQIALGTELYRMDYEDPGFHLARVVNSGALPVGVTASRRDSSKDGFAQSLTRRILAVRNSGHPYLFVKQRLSVLGVDAVLLRDQSCVAEWPSEANQAVMFDQMNDVATMPGRDEKYLALRADGSVQHESPLFILTSDGSYRAEVKHLFCRK